MPKIQKRVDKRKEKTREPPRCTEEKNLGARDKKTDFGVFSTKRREK